MTEHNPYYDKDMWNAALIAEELVYNVTITSTQREPTFKENRRVVELRRWKRRYIAGFVVSGCIAMAVGFFGGPVGLLYLLGYAVGMIHRHIIE